MGQLDRRPDAASNLPGRDADSAVARNLRILQLENRLQRERSARFQAEAIAERHMRELYDKSRALELLETIAAVANENRGVEKTLRFTVEAVCQHTGWQFGNVFVLAPDSPERLVSADIWHAENRARLEPFIVLSRASVFPAGRGLPGRVLSSGKSHWIPDVTVDPNFPRAPVAKACGLHAAFAFPVLIDRETVAVMEFFYRDCLAPDDALLALAGQVGTHLGRVMERKRAEERLVHDATHDPLTGLPNRALFTKLLEEAVAMSAYGITSARFAVLFIDLDRFKLVNDSLGHGAGDAMLVEIARRLSAALAAVAFGTQATLARLGGGELTVLLQGSGAIACAQGVAESLLGSLRAPMQVAGHEIHASASVGVATSDLGFEDAAAILRDADLAMYRAKSEGRARIEVFDRSLHASAKRRLSLEHDLRHAIEREELTLRFQPIVTLADSRIVSFESLLRWEHEGRLVSPLDFIGIAEETGLIVPIGNWILQQACGALASWRKLHPELVRANGWRPLSIAVNVSPRQFRQPDFAARVIAAVEGSGVDPDAVYLEITEGMFMESSARSAAILLSLREFGVHFSIDDFGTGYSSLSYLHRLPVDVVKIDKSFVQGMEDRSGNGVIVQTMLDMARNLDLAVVAEGVETQAQAAELHRMGCVFGQGFLFARPLSLSAATDALVARLPLSASAP